LSSFRYVRDLTKGEIQNNSHHIRQLVSIAIEHEYEFLPYNSAYLQKDNTEKDLNLEAEDYKDKTVTQEHWQ